MSMSLKQLAALLASFENTEWQHNGESQCCKYEWLGYSVSQVGTTQIASSSCALSLIIYCNSH